MSINSLGGYDNPSFRFAKPGDTAVGTIVEEPRKVTTTNDEGKPRDQFVFTLEINHAKSVSHRKQKNNDGTVTLEPVDLSESETWTLWVPVGSKIASAVKAALGKANVRDWPDTVGSLLSVTLTGYGEPSKPGWSPPGLYTAAYKQAERAAASADDDPFAGLV